MKVILILGAAVWANGPSPTLSRRCAHAIKLWKTDPSQVLIPCGGLGQHPPTEAAMMLQLLIEAGVPETKIITEEQSTTTYENIRNAHALLSHAHIEQMTIVSDIYHLPRAALVGRHFGYRPNLSGPGLRGTHLPTQIRHFLREAGAVPLYALKLLGHKWRGHDRR